jgi:alkylhydroperoxidase family enzyme
VAFIQPAPEDEVTGAVAEAYEADRHEDGFVSNLVQAFSHRPEVFSAWLGLKDAVTGPMDQRRYELVTIAAARRVRSSYCMLAHGSVLVERFYEVDIAVMDLSDKIAADAGSVSEADVERLRELGLNDAEIFDVVAAAAMRCFFTKIVDGLGFQPDAAYAELDESLREALVVGRPIEGG